MIQLGFFLLLLAAGIALPPLVAVAEFTPRHSAATHTMSLGPADDYFDLRFIDAMVLHHQGALAMAETAIAESQRPEVLALSSQIISAQRGEIVQMQRWRQAWYPRQSEHLMMWHAAMNHMMPMNVTDQAMMRMDTDLGSRDPQFDLRYLTAMILHHKGALTMATAALKHTQRPEIETLSQSIQREQAQEIEMMQAWLQSWYP